MAHISVLTKESVAALNVERAGTILDCTYGVGGHSRAILEQLGEQGRLMSLDVDNTALEANPATDPRHTLVCANFSQLPEVLAQHDIQHVDGILADLGWRSEQFESAQKGFSFTATEPLVMTFGDPENHVFTAYEVVNEWEEENLADIIYAYGEERAARRIARAIVAARAEAPIETAVALAEVVASAVPRMARKSGLNPATKTFQAIRIAVNDELGALRALLAAGFEALAPRGRFAIITFHSLEDRMVKQTFRSYVHDHKAVAITKKPIVPSTEEVTDNPRARSAKLRIIEKI